MTVMKKRARRSAAADLERRLAREGLSADLSTDGPAGEQTRSYAAAVYGLEAVEIRRIGGGSFSRAFRPEATPPQSAEPDEALARIIERAAVRALYALGHDQGQVTVDVGGNGRATVRSVSGTPHPLTEEGERRLAEAAARRAELLAAESRRPPAATLGADPEFVLLTQDGRVVPASRYFPPGAAAGSDSVVVRGVRRWPLAELRPDPAPEPAALTAALRRLLARASRRVGDAPFIWRAGALPVPGLPLGGHIHLSGVAPTPERLRALDNAVALPLRLLEPPGAARRRPRYGALGDFRRKAHGGFEYRTPPSWLVSPTLACGVLALAKIAAEAPARIALPLDDDRVREAFYGGGGKDKSGREKKAEERGGTIGETGPTREAETGGDRGADEKRGTDAHGRTDGNRGTGRDILLIAVREVMQSVRRTEGYARYGRWIEPLFRAIEEGKTWDESIDLRDRWRVRG